ncbi:MAG: hypothetical protein KAX49_11715 [Halanaerobiales bacterium]|nr:hypothetical protein [Halanaerobiales bacterium]
MSVAERLMGIGLLIVGILLWTLDYCIVSTMVNLGNWLAGLMNASEEVGIGIAILSLCFFPILGIFIIIIALIGSYFLFNGIRLLFDCW